jgi:N-formylglutamate amidohydrolase
MSQAIKIFQPGARIPRRHCVMLHPALAALPMHDAQAPFTRFGPEDPISPLIIAVPHAGRDYPAELIEAAAIPRARLEALEDRLADELISEAIVQGATAFVAHRARAWIDLNRDERELDPQMIEPSVRPPATIGSAKVRGGLGLIPRRIAGSGEILRRRLTAAEAESRILLDHRPWHGALAEALAAARARFGIAILLDCHSMPPIARDSHGNAPRIVIGDRYGRSAAGRFADRVAALADSAGLHCSRNSPYAGGYTLDRHGEPASNVHAIQIEIDRSLYLAPDLRSAGPGMSRMISFVAELASALIDEALPVARAAE